MPDIDYIIVGQGLAGSFLGYSLINLNKKVLIFDSGEENTSSKVAAGIFNPITGQRMALSWNAHKIFPYIDSYYRELERVLKYKFYFPIGIYKPFAQAKDQNDWMGRSTDSSYAPFIKDIFFNSRYAPLIQDSYGGIELHHSGYVNTNVLLRSFNKFFRKKNAFIRQRFDQNALNLYDDHVEYRSHVSQKVIFCEGPTVVQNKYFKNLPFGLVKGEILTVKINQLPDLIISKDIFVLPIGGSMARVGSTYDRDNLNTNITEEAKKYLVKKLNSLLKRGFEVVGQQAGLRPATKDRRPFVGLHPEKKPIGLFNGLGTKGVSLGPYYADQFANFLVFNNKIDEEADLQRYI